MLEDGKRQFYYGRVIPRARARDYPGIKNFIFQIIPRARARVLGMYTRNSRDNPNLLSRKTRVYQISAAHVTESIILRKCGNCRLMITYADDACECR